METFGSTEPLIEASSCDIRASPSHTCIKSAPASVLMLVIFRKAVWFGWHATRQAQSCGRPVRSTAASIKPLGWV